MQLAPCELNVSLGVRKGDEIVIVNNCIVQDLDLDTLDRYLNESPMTLTLRSSRLVDIERRSEKTIPFRLLDQLNSSKNQIKPLTFPMRSFKILSVHLHRDVSNDYPDRNFANLWFRNLTWCVRRRRYHLCRRTRASMTRRAQRWNGC